jgi:hypothetical protein
VRENCKHGSKSGENFILPDPYQLKLISAGTERMLVDFGKAGYIAKARRQPDKVKMVLEKVQTDGLMTTLDAVQDEYIKA